MIKINKKTNTASRESLPQFLQGLNPESLYDLTWTDESLGVQDNTWFDEQDVTVYDSNLVLDGTESFEIDFENHTVKVTKGQRVKTAEELEVERKSIIPQKLTPRQARLILLQYELLDDVEQIVKTNRAISIWWEYSLDIQRDDERLLEFASIAGITDDMLDTMFLEGSKL